MYWVFDKENCEMIPCKTKADAIRQLDFCVKDAIEYMGFDEMSQQFRLFEGDEIDIEYSVKVNF